MAKKEIQTPDRFKDEERAAMKARAKEQKAEARANLKKDEGKNVLEKIGEMPEPDRSMAQRLHKIIAESTPDLWSKTWYGMPAYTKNGKVICFFQAASKFKTRYATLGFQHDANLDDGAMWPTSFAVKDVTVVEEVTISTLVKKAVSWD